MTTQKPVGRPPVFPLNHYCEICKKDVTQHHSKTWGPAHVIVKKEGLETSLSPVSIPQPTTTVPIAVRQDDEYQYLPLHSAVELEHKKFEPPKWCVDKLIPKNSINVIGAKRSMYKTWLALQMALSITTGLPFLDKFPTEKSDVIYIDEEGGEPEMKRRMDMLMTGMGIKHYPGNFHYMCLEGFQLDDDTKDGWYDKLVNTITNEYSHCIIIVDTFRRITNIEENDAGEMNKLLNRIRQFTKPNVPDERKAWDTTWLLLAHMRKGIGGKAPEDRLDELRGSGDLAAGVDTALLLEKAKASTGVVMYQEKCRRWKCQEPYTLDIEETEGESFKFTFTGTFEEALNNADKCAEAIVKWMAEKEIDKFTTGELEGAMRKLKYPHTTVLRATDKLVGKGLVTKIQRGHWERLEGKQVKL